MIFYPNVNWRRIGIVVNNFVQIAFSKSGMAIEIRLAIIVEFIIILRKKFNRIYFPKSKAVLSL